MPLHAACRPASSGRGTPGISSQNRILCISPGWMVAPGSPGSSGLRVLLCQSHCKVFSQSAMPQKLSPVPCLGPAKVNSWTFVLQQRKDSYSPESLKITYSMLQVQTESPVVWGNWKKDSWNFINTLPSLEEAV